MLQMNHIAVTRTMSTINPGFSQNSLNLKLSHWMQKYEDFVGLAEVKLAQSRVLQAETKFVKSQEERREAQRQISSIQQRLHELHAELERIPKGDDKYLHLITQEHMVIKEEKKLREDFQHYEKQERENFAALSNTLRDSHEKERAQAEKTKYWSIIGSILGTVVGVVGTTINNRLRMSELKKLVKESVTGSSSLANLEELSKEFSSVINKNFLSSVQELKLMQPVMPNENWHSLLGSITSMSKMIENQENVNAELNKKLDVLLSAGSPISDGHFNQRQYIFSENELRALLVKEKKDLIRVTLICTAVIPLCTFVINRLF